MRREAAAVVGEPLHRQGRPKGTEAPLDREQNEVAHRDPADPAGAGGPDEDLAIVGVNATRTASPFQHGISNTSAAQRRFEAAVATSPSCGR
jgi:hypothetical protein